MATEARKAKSRKRRAQTVSTAEPTTKDSATGFAAKATGLEAQRTAVVDAANVSAGLWFSYLFVLVYLAIAVGSITHRDLLFESPVKLPFLGVELPLLGFFALGPAIFLIIHAYVLLHVVLLADKVGIFHAALQKEIVDEDVRASVRRQLPSNIFVQFLAGPREVRAGVIGFMLRSIAQISLIVGPISLLVFFELQFLPYHHELITWCQRIAVLVDVIMLWTLWPSIKGRRMPTVWDTRTRLAVVVMSVASLAPLLLVFTIATFPGEWLDRKLPSVRFIPAWRPPEVKVLRDDEGLFTRPRRPVVASPWTSLYELLVAGDVNFIDRKPTSLWSNRLVLPGINALDHLKLDENKIATLATTVSLRGRRLEGAVLIDARLRKADFTGAFLQGALLGQADLRQATFKCADPRGKGDGISVDLMRDPLQCAQLQGASLDFAQLQGASLEVAQLQNTSWRYAQLQGASLRGADLRGASLANARLQGALLDFAQLPGVRLNQARLQGATLDSALLHGASLDEAELQGASLKGAELQGASLDSAQLQGASLELAKLQGASLYRAQLQGTVLDSADLRGAILDAAQLQGASLSEADLWAASLEEAFVWRADAREANVEGARVIDPQTNARDTFSGNCSIETPCDWSAKSFAALRDIMTARLPEGDQHKKALERIEILDPGRVDQETESAMSNVWLAVARSPPALDAYETILAEVWRTTGCATDGTHYLIQALVRRQHRFKGGSTQVTKLAESFLNETDCPGARDLPEVDKAEIRKIRDRVPRSSDGPQSTAQP